MPEPDPLLVAEAHRLSIDGFSHRQIAKQLGRGKTTIAAWLKRPVPAATSAAPEPSTTPPQQPDPPVMLAAAAFALPHATLEALQAEAQRQQQTPDRILDHAIRLYIDAMMRYYVGSKLPIPLSAYLPAPT